MIFRWHKLIVTIKFRILFHKSLLQDFYTINYFLTSKLSTVLSSKIYRLYVFTQATSTTTNKHWFFLSRSIIKLLYNNFTWNFFNNLIFTHRLKYLRSFHKKIYNNLKYLCSWKQIWKINLSTKEIKKYLFCILRNTI